jgi:hypothetical protein
MIRLIGFPLQWHISNFTSLKGQKLYSPRFVIGAHIW